MTDTSTIIRPLNRATLPQEIVKALTDLIMNRVWKPGDLIPSEKELAILRESLEDVRAGRGMPLEEFMAKLAEEFQLPPVPPG